MRRLIFKNKKSRKKFKTEIRLKVNYIQITMDIFINIRQIVKKHSYNHCLVLVKEDCQRDRSNWCHLSGVFLVEFSTKVPKGNGPTWQKSNLSGWFHLTTAYYIDLKWLKSILARKSCFLVLFQNGFLLCFMESNLHTFSTYFFLD